MPQLIAMVLVVVGALVYMFQSFGGTGNNIEGMAQKTSVITEINNIKNGLQIALASKDIENTKNDATAYTGLTELAKKEYFTSQINEQLTNANNTDANATYDAISFGADKSMLISLVINDANTDGGMTVDGIDDASNGDQNITHVPGIKISISNNPVTALSENRNFIESQIAKDLKPIAWVDRGTSNNDGEFTVYYKDLPKNKIKEN